MSPGTWYDRLPKVELHVHLEGAIPHEALFALIQKYGGDTEVPDVAALARRFEYRDFAQSIGPPPRTGDRDQGAAGGGSIVPRSRPR